MPFFPEFLYQLSQRDLQVTWLDPVFTFQTSSQTLAQFNLDPIYTVPPDRVLLLKHFIVIGVPGAGQNVQYVAGMLYPPGGSAVFFFPLIEDNIAAPVANVQRNVRFEGELVVPPGWTFFAQAIWNAGAVANTIRTSIIGLLIPSGNIQRV